MQKTIPIQVHVFPSKFSAGSGQIHGVYSVDVDSEDTPARQAASALKALRENVDIRNRDDIEILVLEPHTARWLSPAAEVENFPSDAEFNGRIDADLLPPGVHLATIDKGSPTQWVVLRMDGDMVHLQSEDAGDEFRLPISEVIKEFLIFTGYGADRELDADGLEDKYMRDHPMQTRAMWREAVANEDTILGYWSWVAHELKENSGAWLV